MKANFLLKQNEVNDRIRGILIAWLIEIHYKFKLIPETLYLCCNIIDRYCEKKQIAKDNFQLIGVAAMFVACKYEEIYPPEIKDFIFVSDKSYTRKQILEYENDILMTLDFNMTICS